MQRINRKVQVTCNHQGWLVAQGEVHRAFRGDPTPRVQLVRDTTPGGNITTEQGAGRRPPCAVVGDPPYGCDHLPREARDGQGPLAAPPHSAGGLFVRHLWLWGVTVQLLS